jgi:transcriptional regulator with XRE-family HTH domain
MFMFLQSLIRKKVDDERLSLRRAASQIGISHTTLRIFMLGQRVDMPTLELICKWANVSVRDALGYDKESDLNSAVAAVASASPELGQLFQDAAQSLANGEIAENDLREIIQYVSFRLKMAKERHTA